MASKNQNAGFVEAEAIPGDFKDLYDQAADLDKAI